MTDEEFWRLIEMTDKKARHDEQAQAALLTRELAKRSSDEIISFAEKFSLHAMEAYDDRLYAAGSIIREMDDDEFWQFRYWLVSRGRKVFSDFMKDPDSLAGVIESRDHEFGAAISAAPQLAYEEVTGKYDLWDRASKVEKPAQLRNQVNWAPNGYPDEERLRKLLPRLWAKFGER